MQVPPFVRRATLRVIAGGGVGALVIAIGGVIGERIRFGPDLTTARTRIEEDVRRQFATLGMRLEVAVDGLRRDPAVLAASETRDIAAIRTLFDRLAAAEGQATPLGVAVTIYGPDARPIAWAGRPATLPIVRVTGPESLFLAQGALGLRLARVVPVTSPAAADRRLATLVAEASLPGAAGNQRDQDGFVVETSVVPVPVRPGFESAAGADTIVVRTASGEPLAAVDVPSSEIARARGTWRTRVWAAEAAVLCALLLLLCGPLLDWRRVLPSVGGHVAMTAGILAFVLGARVIAWYGLRLAELHGPPLVARDIAGRLWVALASPVDFLLTALAVGAGVGLAASSFEQWRQSRRLRARVVPGGRSWETTRFVVAQLTAGAMVGGLLVGYEELLRTRLALMPYDILHFSLHPVDPLRLAVGVGIVVLHAALLALAVLVFRVALTPWVIAPGDRWVRGWIPVLWLAPAAAILAATVGTWERPPMWPALLVVTAAIVIAWRFRRARAALEHASQAARLMAFLVALAVPSVVFYPSLVDAAGRARQQLVESRFAPEVVNQRRSLQLQVNQALTQIDAVADLDDLVSAGIPVTTGPPPTDLAFRVWSGTVLKNQRSTSVELHDARGTLVSRFALELPLAGGPQTYRALTCQWEVLEEVSPFFAEERRLLHAGRDICRDRPGRPPEVVGSISVHAMLDYSNLSFISAQSPYVALLRRPGDDVEPTSREAIEFNVYGWSRRPLYMSGRDAWPLPEEVFQRILASREPFWATVRRGDTTYEVYFLNDRGAIYALGYSRASGFEHLISTAELVALAAAAYLALLAAGVIYGLIAARTPTSGRELLREVRASFYRKLFIAFVAAAVLPVLVLALATRAYIANLMQVGLEMEAARTAASASRVVEDVGPLNTGDDATAASVNDDLVVWLSRVIAQDVNIFDGSGLLASSERNLFVSGLLPTRTDGDMYRAIMLEGRPSFVGRESLGSYQYLVAAAPVRVQNRDAILTVPLTLRQQEIVAQINELDRRVLLAAVLFIMLGAGIGYSMAERIADPVNRLMKATGRIARGDLDARILETSSDEFRRLVEAFNRMAADLQRQRVELERTNRLAAWADMARQVAHDIKNPLTPVQLNAEHLRRVHDDRGAPLGPVLDECVDNILRQVRLLRQLASEFSSFATSPTARRQPTSLQDLVGEVVGPYRAGLASRVRITSDLSPTLPLLMVDKTILARALTNIVENALHAMPDGGALQLAARQLDHDRVELAIADTGVGMDDASLARIFEPYFSTRASGSGLGLTIAKRNVELNGGTIDVESAKGKGTTVRLTLPTAA